MATEEAPTERCPPVSIHDTRRDTPFKALPAAGPTYTGHDNWGDTRRDTAAKG